MNIITLPANFNSQIASTAQSFFADFASPVTLIIGILLGVAVIGILIRMFMRH